MDSGRANQKLGVALVLALLALAVVAVLNPFQRSLDQMVTAIQAEFPRVNLIEPRELENWLRDAQRIPPELLDVRTEEEFAVSHLRGARRVDPAERASSLLQTLDANRPVVLYCSVGYRSSQMADQLRVLGRTNVFGLRGAVFAWANAGLPLVNDHGQPTPLVHPFSDTYAAMLQPEHRFPISRMTSLVNDFVPRVNPTRTVYAMTWLVVLLSWETLWPFFGFFRARPRERTAHAARNLALGALNTVLIAALFVKLWAMSAAWAETRGFGLLHWLRLPRWAHVAAAVLLLDAWTYVWHRLNHGIPLFWHFHRTHHSELCLDVTSASRFHPGELIFSSVLRLPLLALLGIRFNELVLYETLMFAVVQFHHANIQLPAAVQRALGWLIVTPNMHRVHHSRLPVETDSNFSALLSVWDRLFGTWRWRADPAAIRYGLDGFDTPEQHTVGGMLKTPLRQENRPGHFNS